MVIYVCSPLRSTHDRSQAQHQQDARHYMAEVLNLGHSPIVPHLLLTQVLDDDSPIDREVGIRAGLELLGTADEVWVFGPYLSEGMRREVRFARVRGTPVRWFPGGRVAGGHEITVDWIHLRGADGKIVDAEGDALVPAGRPD
jgi:hypothetical protein